MITQSSPSITLDRFAQESSQQSKHNRHPTRGYESNQSSESQTSSDILSIQGSLTVKLLWISSVNCTFVEKG